MTKLRNWSILLLGIAALTLAGCNTIEGAGEDVEDLGESVQDASD